MMEKIIRLVEAVARNIGAFSLLAVMLLVSLSVAGRHLSIPLPGSIEIAEVLIALIASASFIFATFQDKHAIARLLIDHVSMKTQALLEKLATFFSIVICLSISYGSMWLIIDVWDLFEETPLLLIPIVPFRIIWFAATFLGSLYLLRVLLHLLTGKKITRPSASLEAES
jgi:TRAP-type C4-dicarboxylate transport system permease small subunit